MKRFFIGGLFSFILFCGFLSSAQAASLLDDYQYVLAKLPPLGAQATNLPNFVRFDGSPDGYYGMFDGKYGKLSISGYVQEGLIYSLTISPDENLGLQDASLVAKMMVKKYSSPSFTDPNGQVYEWQYRLNGVRWSIMLNSEAGVISGQRG